MPYNTVRYSLQHCSSNCKIWIKVGTHRRHSISHLHEIIVHVTMALHFICCYWSATTLCSLCGLLTHLRFATEPRNDTCIYPLWLPKELTARILWYAMPFLWAKRTESCHNLQHAIGGTVMSFYCLTSYDGLWLDLMCEYFPQSYGYSNNYTVI